MHDVIVVGMGPGGAATASMLRTPAAFGIRSAAGQLDVLALEARGLVPTRDRVVGLWSDAVTAIGQADDVIGRFGDEATVFTDPSGWGNTTSRISSVERTFREAAETLGVDARYGVRVAGVEDLGRAGVRVTMEDGTVERARFLVDGTGARLGPFQHGEPAGEIVYLTGQVPPIQQGARGGWQAVKGAGNERSLSGVASFNDARMGGTVYVKYPSLPAKADDATWTKRTLRRHLEDAGMDPRGLRNAEFIVTPLVRAPSAANGSMLAVGDAVRRLSPETALGVTNALSDARGAAWAIHSTLDGTATQADAFSQYALAASRR